MKIVQKKKTDARDRSGYKFFVVIKPEGSPFRLESGWDNLDDAKTMSRELPGYLNAKAFALTDLKRMSLNPANENHWYKEK